MRKNKTRRFHIPAVVVICSAVILIGAACNIWYWKSKNAEINTIDLNTSTFIANSDKQIADIKERNAAEEKARQEAAKAAAEQAMTADGSKAASVNSSVCNGAKTHNNPANIDVVVNKKHCIQPVTYEPSDLVTTNGATVSAQIVDAFNQLFTAAAAAGQPFYVTSSYRSYQTQVATYNYWVSTSGAAGADTYSARPGYSEHQTGFAFDVAAHGCVLDCFGSTSQYAWFQQYAADYGFVQRYYSGYEAITGYKAEEWHYRYVGKAVAKDMQLKGIMTLEEYWSVSGGDY